MFDVQDYEHVLSTLLLFCHIELPALDAVILPTSGAVACESIVGELCLDDGGRQEGSKASGNRDVLRNVTVRSYCMIYVKRRDVHIHNIKCTKYLRAITFFFTVSGGPDIG